MSDAIVEAGLDPAKLPDANLDLGLVGLEVLVHTFPHNRRLSFNPYRKI